MYTVATVSRLDRNSNGSLSLVLVFTGDAGETPVECGYTLDARVAPGADYLRGLAMQRLASLNINRNFMATIAPTVGSVLDTTTPLPAGTTDSFGEYMAGAVFTPGATPQDVFTISGAAGKTVRVIRLSIATTQTTAGMNAWALIKRSTANAGGTSAVIPAVPIDSAYPAAAAVLRSYSVNAATPGAAVGTLLRTRVPSPVASASTVQPENFLSTPGRGPLAVLRSAAENLALNFNGTALPAGLSVALTVGWTEQ